MSASAHTRRLLELAYSVPDPFDTLEAFERFRHGDLARLSLSTLLVERDRLRLRLLLDPRPPSWLRERWRLLQERLRDAR